MVHFATSETLENTGFVPLYLVYLVLFTFYYFLLKNSILYLILLKIKIYKI